LNSDTIMAMVVGMAMVIMISCFRSGRRNMVPDFIEALQNMSSDRVGNHELVERVAVLDLGHLLLQPENHADADKDSQTNEDNQSDNSPSGHTTLVLLEGRCLETRTRSIDGDKRSGRCGSSNS
jgi:hypothetical protein